jgi:hypothetical protein
VGADQEGPHAPEQDSLRKGGDALFSHAVANKRERFLGMLFCGGQVVGFVEIYVVYVAAT